MDQKDLAFVLDFRRSFGEKEMDVVRQLLQLTAIDSASAAAAACVP